MLIFLTILILLIFIIPGRFWSKGLIIIKAKKLKFFEMIPVSQVKRGEELLNFISGGGKARGRGDEKLNIPLYKFFSTLVLSLYHTRRVLGAEIENIIFELKLAIVKDLQFEKKLRGLVLNSWGQFFAMSFLTWGFIFLTMKMIKVTPTQTVIILIIILQISGSGLFTLIYFFLKKKTLKEVYIIESPLHGLKSLTTVGLPLSVICERVQIENLWTLKEKALVSLVKRLFSAIEDLKNRGLPLKNTLDEILGEVHFIRDQKYQKFILNMSFVKFLVLALFYLSSYFIFIMSLFSSLMLQI